MKQCSEASVLRGLRQGDESMLEWVIDNYSAYVYAVIINVISPAYGAADAEEVASDVFFALWNNAAKIREGSLKSYLGTIARNKAIDMMRSANQDLPLDESVIQAEDCGFIETAEKQERNGFLRQAVLDMGEPEREIFTRFYFRGEHIPEIASAMSLNENTVKTHLRRGRIALKEIMQNGGYNV